MTDTEMTDDSSEEDYVRKPKFIQPPKNFATLSEKNVRENKRARKTLEQNITKEKNEKKNKNKLKNIETTQQQMTTNVKMTDTEMTDDSSKENYVRKPKFIQPPENFATLSEKNIRENKRARKTLEQNKTEEKKEKKNKNKFKNIETTQQQIIVKVPYNKIITKPNAADYIRIPIYIPQSKNFATLSEKNVRKIKHASEKLVQNKKELKDIEVTQEQIDTKNILKTEGEEQKSDSENQDFPLSPLSLLSPVSLISPLPLSPPSDSGKDYTTLPSVTSQMITMEKQDYDHIIPTNIDEESKKVELSEQIDRKKFYVESLSKLLADFNEMKQMLNINTIKIMELLEENKLSESK